MSLIIDEDKKMKLYHVDYASIKPPMPPAVGIDVELANKNTNSICAIAISWINGNCVKGKKWLVKPPTDNFIYTNRHGISSAMVANAEPFYVVWDKYISPIMRYNVFASHYCYTPMRSIIDSYESKSSKVFASNDYIVYDTHLIARDIWTKLDYCTLDSIAAKFNIKVNTYDVLSRSLCILNILNSMIAKYTILTNAPKIMAYVANKHCFTQWINGDIDDYGLSGNPEIS